MRRGVCEALIIFYVGLWLLGIIGIVVASFRGANFFRPIDGASLVGLFEPSPIGGVVCLARLALVPRWSLQRQSWVNMVPRASFQRKSLLDNALTDPLTVCSVC